MEKVKYIVTIKNEYLKGVLGSSSILKFGYFVGELEECGEEMRFKTNHPSEEECWIIIPKKYIECMVPDRDAYEKNFR